MADTRLATPAPARRDGAIQPRRRAAGVVLRDPKLLLGGGFVLLLVTIALVAPVDRAS